jgi:hypothetical protein
MYKKEDLDYLNKGYCAVHHMNISVKSKREASNELSTVKMERVDSFYTEMYGLQPFYKPLTSFFISVQTNEKSGNI